MDYQLSGIIATMLMSAWFAGSETVFLSFNKAVLPIWVKQQARGANTVKFLTDRPERFLVTTLTGNNLVNVAYSSLFAIWMTGHGISEELIYIAAPFFLLIFGETVPKAMGHQLADSSVRGVAVGLAGVRWLLYPLVRNVEAVVGSMQNRLGLKEAMDWTALRRVDISTVLHHAEQTGILPESAMPLMKRIMSVSGKRVADIMTHRTGVVSLSHQATIRDARSQMIESGHSRLPCYEGDLDNVIGMVQAKSLLREVSELSEIIHPLPMVPVALPALRLMGWMRNNNCVFAGVVDEYGGFAGVVSVEDLVEELVGPIADEYDLPHAGFVRLTEYAWIVDSQVRLSHLEQVTPFNPPETNSTSVGGLVTELAGSVPTVGDVLQLPNASLRVLRADPQGARVIRLTIRSTIADDDKT